MISTQVVDSAEGRPVPRMPVELDVFITGKGWHAVGYGMTSDEGRIETFGEPAAVGVYRLMFDVASYLPNGFFPSISIAFDVRDEKQQYHVPLLVSNHGYSTYRGV